VITETVYACEDPRTGTVRHNRCVHPTPPPPGRRRCLGDPACAIWLPDQPGAPLLCRMHEDEAAIRLSTEMDRHRILMEGR